MRVIWDHPEPCPYLPGRVARLPLRFPGHKLQPAEFDRLLEEGDRRSGRFLYRATCGECRECRAIRVPVADFRPNTSQRRSLKRNEDVVVTVQRPACTAAQLDLYNRHKMERGLSRTGEALTAEGYGRWLVDSCTDTVELEYRVDGRLIAVSVLDLGATAVSSVYHYFDPDESRRSLGVFSVLWELAWCKLSGFQLYYLGYYVAGCNNLNYKANYTPCEIKTDGGWERRE